LLRCYDRFIANFVENVTIKKNFENRLNISERI